MRSSKKLISVLLALMLIVSALPLSVFAAKTKESELLLATVSDIHYYPETLAKYKGEAFYTYLQGANCVYENLNGILDSTFDALAKDAEEKGLKYLVVCGDLTTNGEYEGHVALAERFREFEKESGIKVFVINGNHDINNTAASDFSFPDGKKHEAKRTSPMDFYNIYYEFGFDEAESTFSAPDTGKAGALSYALSVDGYRFIMIDAGKYTADNTDKQQDVKETGGNMTDGVLSWVEKQAEIAKKNGETPIAFTHWNASEMNYLHGEVLQGFVLDNGYILQEKLADMGIHYIFSGHQHVSDISVTYSDSGEPLYSIITPTLTQYPFAFRETLFNTDSNGNVTAEFNQYDCDITKNVVSDSGAALTAPYRYTGFNMQFGGGTPEGYLMMMVKGLLGKYVESIKSSGSIVQMIRDEFGFDLRNYLDDLINGGISLGNLSILSVDNLMSFIADLDEQIYNNYIKDTDRLWNVIETAVTNLISIQVSEIPCTKFIETYGFGSKTAPGTLGDVFFSALVYMYSGNEDISDDLFIQDVLSKIAKPEFVDLIFNAAREYLIHDLILDELLGNLYVHVNTLFNGSYTSVANFLQFLYKIITGLTSENIFSSDSVLDFVQKLFDIATRVTYDDSATTYKYLLEYILSTGLISYGSSVDELIDYLIDNYFGEAGKEATAYQLWVVINGVFNDADIDSEIDYSYAGAEKIAPTVEDMQLPSDINVQLKDNDLIIHWLTKYSVTGTDIVITDKSTGKKVASSKIKAVTEKGEYTSNGFSFGSFGILPYTRIINDHTVTVSSLTRGKTYVYKIGDASKGFWSDTAEIYIPKTSDEDFSFLFLSNIASGNPSGYEAWARTLKAGKAYSDASFALLAGSSVLNGNDDAQFSLALNTAGNTLRGLPLYYAAGKNDAADTAMVKKHFASIPADKFADDTSGSYYSFDYSGVHFAVINTNDVNEDGTLISYQFDWLNEDLEGSDAHWKIVVMHDPVIGGDSINEALLDQLLPVLSSASVDLLLQGGENSYYRSYMIRQGSFIKDTDTIIKKINGREYVSLVSVGTLAINGGTAANYLGEATPDSSKINKAVSQNAPMFTAITVSGEDIIIRACEVDENGKVKEIDSFSVAKSGKSLLLGDIDLDESVTAADARLALRYAVGLEELSNLQKLAANVDKDLAITAADARLILRAAVKLDKIIPERLVYTDVDLKNVKL
ncbi:MAG: metallophosphoesterase [Oscillospiraceae bacterium]|nr:metallophosphoesterase [Oscillospiraceae bacterium]